MNSNLFRLNWNDLSKGMLVAVYSAVLAGLYGFVSTLISTQAFPTWAAVFSSLKTIGVMALLSGLAYLLKNLLTNSTGQPLAPEVK